MLYAEQMERQRRHHEELNCWLNDRASISQRSLSISLLKPLLAVDRAFAMVRRHSATYHCAASKESAVTNGTNFSRWRIKKC